MIFPFQHKRTRPDDFDAFLQPPKRMRLDNYGINDENRKELDDIYSALSKYIFVFTPSQFMENFKERFSKISGIEPTDPKYNFVDKVLQSPEISIIALKSESMHLVRTAPFAKHCKYVISHLNHKKSEEIIKLNCTSEELVKIENVLESDFKQFMMTLSGTTDVSKEKAELEKDEAETFLNLLDMGIFLGSKKLKQFAVEKLNGYFSELKFGNPKDAVMIISALNETLISVTPACRKVLEAKISVFLNRELEAKIYESLNLLQMIEKPITLVISSNRLQYIKKLKINALEICFNPKIEIELDNIIQALQHIEDKTHIEKIKLDEVFEPTDDHINTIVSLFPNLISLECNFSETTGNVCEILSQKRWVHLNLKNTFNWAASDISRLLKSSMRTLQDFIFDDGCTLEKEQFSLFTKMQKIKTISLFQSINGEDDRKDSLDDDRISSLKSETLENLIISDASITDVSLKHIAENLPSLKFLNISGCTEITHKGIQTLAILPLHILNIFDCNGLNNQTIDSLKNISSLKYLIFCSDQFSEDLVKEALPKVRLEALSDLDS